MLIEIMVGLVSARIDEKPFNLWPPVFGAVCRGAFVVATSSRALSNGTEIDDLSHAEKLDPIGWPGCRRSAWFTLIPRHRIDRCSFAGRLTRLTSLL
jgi:hypothetical protein